MSERPSNSARILALMGSGETSPTMVKVHREILDHLKPGPVSALLLDTPFGFQENAVELAHKAQAYFEESLLTKLDVVTMADLRGDLGHQPRQRDEPMTNERLLMKMHEARYVFSGPGSPSYALRKWHGTSLTQLLKEKLEFGGAVTFASAAALTLGAFTVPVYEIYKVGEDPYWLDGLDVLSTAGLRVAVIPHYNNAEGGTHDTRYCYLGARRLQVLEDQLPDDCFVLGVDEHTSMVIDLESRTVAIGGIGTVTVRKSGHSTVFERGEITTIDDLIAAAFSTPGSTPSVEPTMETLDVTDFTGASSRAESPLLGIVRDAESSFDAAIVKRDAVVAGEAILELEQQIHDWSSDVPGQDEMVRARASLRSMIIRLSSSANDGLRDPREVLGPFIEALISDRRRARDEGRFAEADEIRFRLVALGVEIRDSPHLTAWALVQRA